MLIEFAGKQTATVIGTHKLTAVQVSCDTSVTGILQDSQVVCPNDISCITMVQLYTSHMFVLENQC